ncbi:restriction endonuclease subunit S [Thiolapillus sp.]
MGYSTYENWTETGKAWPQTIPQHWELKKFRFLFKFGRGLGITKSDLLDEGIPCVNYGEIHSKFGFEVIPEQHDLKCVDEANLETGIASLLNDGDFVFADTSEDIEGSGNFTYLNSETPTFAGYHTVIARPTTNNLSRFLAYLFDSEMFRFQIRKNVSGVKVYSITQDILKNCRVWLPPIEEQEKIVHFLDYKTRRIDRLIRKKKALIARLDEQRIAVITQAVTKGIQENTKMKPSGIEWLGDVPEHWEILKLRFVGECQNGISIGGEYFGRGYPFVSYSDVFNNKELPEAVTGLVDSSEKDRKVFSVVRGDVFFTRTSETVEDIAMTSVCLKTIEDAVFAGFLIRFRPTPGNLYEEFSKYFFQNALLRAFFVKEMNLVTRASLSQDLLRNLPVLIPPLQEQESIANHLNSQTQRLDKIKRNLQAAIKRLEEYRTSLITAAVSGKIDVRSIKIPKGE